MLACMCTVVSIRVQCFIEIVYVHVHTCMYDTLTGLLLYRITSLKELVTAANQGTDQSKTTVQNYV